MCRLCAVVGIATILIMPILAYAKPAVEVGIASVYSNKFQGRKTAMGTRFSQRKLTAAHHWLPLGAQVRVTSFYTGKSVTLTITDRLAKRGRIIDLSAAAAHLLGMAQPGLMKVWLSR